MQPPTTRRKFIATLGVAGTLSLAGCSSIPGGDSSSTSSPTTTNDTGTRTSSQTNATEGNNKKTEGKTSKGTKAPGESIDDFEGKIPSRWEINYGRYKSTNQDVFQGSQSLVLEPKNPKKGVVRITKYFNPALDLSKHDLSIAAKVNKPEDVTVKAEVLAPAGGSKLLAARYIPQELDQWVRFDLGYVGVKGNPVMDKVTQVSIQIGSLGVKNDFQVLIDDLRKIPKPSKGKVMFQFDDTHVTAFNKAYPVLQENGWSGSIAITPDSIGAEDRVTQDMMHEMSNAGWDMIGHAGTILPKLKEQEQRRILQEVHRDLSIYKYKKGARHFVAPSSRVDATTLKLINEIYDTAYLFGACPNNAQHPSNPNFISRVQGPSVRGVRRILDVAEQTNQLVVISYHILGDGPKATPMREFREIVNQVKKKDMDVITPSQLVDSKNW